MDTAQADVASVGRLVSTHIYIYIFRSLGPVIKKHVSKPLRAVTCLASSAAPADSFPASFLDSETPTRYQRCRRIC